MTRTTLSGLHSLFITEQRWLYTSDPSQHSYRTSRITSIPPVYLYLSGHPFMDLMNLASFSLLSLRVWLVVDLCVYLPNNSS